MRLGTSDDAQPSHDCWNGTLYMLTLCTLAGRSNFGTDPIATGSTPDLDWSSTRSRLEQHPIPTGAAPDPDWSST